MAPILKNVTIIGAKGSLGDAVVKELVSRPEHVVKVLSRTAGSIQGVETTPVDYDDLAALTKVFEGQDVIISLVGPGGWRAQKKAIDAAISAGVRRFIPSEYGADTCLPDTQKVLLFRNAGKFEVAEHLRAHEGEIEYTYIYTGLFYDWSLDNGFIGIDLTGHTAELWDGGEQPLSGTLVPDIAVAVANVLAKPEETKNRAVRISSLDTTIAAVLTEVERQTGTAFSVTRKMRDQVREESDALLAEGKTLEGTFLDLRLNLFDGSEKCHWATNDNDLLGVRTSTLEAIVKDAIAAKLSA